jgi:hypothetical protein
MPVEMVFGEMTMTVNMPVYGEFREACGGATIKDVMSIILDSVPATFLYAFEGMTMSIPQQIVTMPWNDAVDGAIHDHLHKHDKRHDILYHHD